MNISLLDNLNQLDTRLVRWFSRRRYLQFWQRCARYISHSADGPLYAVLALSLYLGLRPEGPQAALVLVLAFVLERPLYLLMKNSFKRNRPPQALENFSSAIIPSDRFSFPSGHTSGAFVVACAMSYYFPSASPLLYAWSCLVASSRVLLGVHFPGDTLMGALLGYSCASLSLYLLI